MACLLYTSEQLRLITRLASILDSPSLFQSEVIDKLNELKSYVIGNDRLEFFVTTDSERQASSARSQIQQFIQALPEASESATFDAEHYPLLNSDAKATLIEFPFQVHYASQSYLGVPYACLLYTSRCV